MSISMCPRTYSFLISTRASPTAPPGRGVGAAPPLSADSTPLGLCPTLTRTPGYLPPGVLISFPSCCGSRLQTQKKRVLRHSLLFGLAGGRGPLATPLEGCVRLPSSVTLFLGRSGPERVFLRLPLNEGLAAVLTTQTPYSCKGFSVFDDCD